MSVSLRKILKKVTEMFILKMEGKGRTKVNQKGPPV
jgi:hypothetical protein